MQCHSVEMTQRTLPRLSHKRQLPDNLPAEHPAPDAEVCHVAVEGVLRGEAPAEAVLQLPEDEGAGGGAGGAGPDAVAHSLALARILDLQKEERRTS